MSASPVFRKVSQSITTLDQPMGDPASKQNLNQTLGLMLYSTLSYSIVYKTVVFLGMSCPRKFYFTKAFDSIFEGEG